MYDYNTQRANLFTEEGQVIFMKIRDKAKELINASGAVMMEKLLSVYSGDTWTMMACMDRMVELGELKELSYGYEPAGQHRVFVSTSSRL